MFAQRAHDAFSAGIACPKYTTGGQYPAAVPVAFGGCESATTIGFVRTASPLALGMNVLLLAYECDPSRGSEPGVGWNWAVAIAQSCNVWLVTQEANRDSVLESISGTNIDAQRCVFVEHDPRTSWLRHAPWGYYLRNQLWQDRALAAAIASSPLGGFDLAHHITWGNCWQPSALRRLPVPFLWGPVGGAETAPLAFRRSYSARGNLYELTRDLVRTVSRVSPPLKATARAAALTLSRTPESAGYLTRMGAGDVIVRSELTMAPSQVGSARDAGMHNTTPHFISVGNLLHWKGFHLAIEAIASLHKQGLPVEYTIVGAGPERDRLLEVARRRGLHDYVRILGRMPREAVLELMRQSDALIHPSLHDSGGTVCVEAMSLGLPVICLALGGPGFNVHNVGGICVEATSPRQAIQDIADSLYRIATEHEYAQRLSAAGVTLAATAHSTSELASEIPTLYERALGQLTPK